MAYETVKDVFDRVRNFHHQVSEYYHRLHDLADKERVKILLDYMSRHERKLEKYISEYEDDAPKVVLDSWFKYTPASTYKECIEDSEMNPDMSIGDVITVAMRLDDCLISAFKRIVDNAESTKIKEVFRSLLSGAEKEKREFVKAAIELKDL